MRALEAKALAESKPARDAKELQEYQERRLSYVYDNIKNSAMRGHTRRFVENSAYIYQALLAAGYECKRCDGDEMIVSWEDPK